MSNEFIEPVADALFALPFVRGVGLGGSRATGRGNADADWDLSLYYDDGFDPGPIGELGWPADVYPLGGWGGGLFDGGAFLDVEGQKVDVHYRRLATVQERVAECRRGEFWVERLPMYLAGVPSYVLVAEAALQLRLRGETPSAPEYPGPLRENAARFWRAAAGLSVGYARAVTEPALVVGNLARALVERAHADLSARGVWVTNEKRMLRDAGLHGVPLELEAVGSAVER